MSAIKNLKIRTRLAFGFGILLVLLIFAGTAGVRGMASVHDSLDDIVRVNNKQADLAIAMRIAVTEVAVATRDTILLNKPQDIQRANEAVQKSRTAYDAAESELTRLFSSDPSTTREEAALLAKVKEIKERARPLISKVVQLGSDNRNEEAIQALNAEVAAPQRLWLDTLAELADLEEKLTAESVVQAESAYESGRNIVIAMCAIGVAIGILAAWMITKSITEPIAQAVEVARTVAAGDLRSRIEVTSKDETGQLLAALKAMNESLVSVVTTVRDGSENVATGATQIATGNADLSQRTEEQAANLEQTAASMEELSSTVQANAETARQATQLASEASAVAERGGSVVGKVVATMEEISSSSKKINDIIGVIDGIAFQTNILALNAAVEAARAGEQGRGFAVVAGEVRSLAQRSATAAKEIKDLIGASVEKVDAGTRLVGEAGSTMDDIVAQVRRVSHLIGEISAATGEQTQGIGQVSDAVAQLDQVTQQNAALVEESAAAADSLNQQASRLVQAVGVFKINAAASTTRPAIALTRI